MVRTCVAFKCNAKQDESAKEKGLHFYRFPANKRKRLAWVKAINRDGWTPSKFSYLCSLHFEEGWHSDDPNDNNYAPTLFTYKNKTQSESDKTRCDRIQRRNSEREMIEAASKKALVELRHKAFSVESHSAYCLTEFNQDVHSSKPDVPIPSEDIEGDVIEDTDIKVNVNKGNQTDLCEVVRENVALKQDLQNTKENLAKLKWNHNRIKDNDVATKFYTGLPTFAVFLWLYNFLLPKAEKMTYWCGKMSEERVRFRATALPLIDQLFAVLMRLRLGLLVQDVADRFQISTTTFSKYFTTWVCFLRIELKIINPFPSRALVNQTMPLSFKEKYPSVRVIIDCTEVFIQRSSSLSTQNDTFSNYKHHNTLKFLVGITPSGVISFVSDAWGGNASDRKITMGCGLLALLNEGDSVMADKGFTIRDLLEEKNCHLNIPPFRGQSSQFSTDEVFETQEIAELRIHVERSIGRVKNFHIFDGILPITLVPLASDMFQVCCWLTNLDVPLVKK